MSERGYFDKRYAIPGFTFIVIILMYNFHPIYLILKYAEVKDISALLLGIFTVFISNAIGFLISQQWWSDFQREGAHFRWRHDKRPVNAVETMRRKYSIPELKCANKSQYEAYTLGIYGYIVQFEAAKEEYKDVFNYAIRRWDLFHLLSSTIYSINYAFYVFVVIRVIFILSYVICSLLISNNVNLFIINVSNINFELGSFIFLFELFSWIVIILISRRLKNRLNESRMWVLTQYDTVSRGLINQSRITDYRIHRLFNSN